MCSKTECGDDEWLQWNVVDPDEIVRRAACTVVSGTTEFVPDVPSLWENTLCDRRMGPVQRNERCATCGESQHCPGHWGVAPLAHPVLPAHFVPHVKRALRERCLVCEHPLPDPRAKRCSQCDSCPGTLQWNASLQVFVSRQTITIQDKKHVVEKRLHAAEVLRLLRDDVRKRMFLTHLVVLPPCARPYHRSPRGMECDHLTTLYARVLAANQAVAASASASDFCRDEVVAALGRAVNALCSEKQKSAKPSKDKRSRRRDEVGGVAQRLRGKEGRFRQNLLGGTTFFCSRAVVTGASELRVDEIGVPAEVAHVLTVPAIVSAANLPQAQRAVELHEVVRVERGDEAHEVTPHTAQRVRLWMQPGDVAHRRLQNGDVVLVNRQPSLHRHSMMALRVVVVPFKTMRLNPVLCKAYNADFDGDEMNIFVPQTLAARVEAMEIMGVPHNVVSSQTSLPTMGLIMDAVLGCYRLADAFMDRADALQFLSVAQVWDLPPPTVMSAATTLWSGYALLSALFPRAFHYESADVEIRAGEIVRGRITKKHVGAEPCSIVDVMAKTCGASTVVDFLSRVHAAVNWWMAQHGFSVSCADAQCDVDACDALLAASMAEPDPLRLRGLRDEVGSAAVRRLAARGDNFVQMVDAASKGTKSNLISMVVAVGTQVVDGRLPPQVMVSGAGAGRAVPHFTTAETRTRSAARGFVGNNFRTGLNVPETFFCAEWGRGSIVDTNGKTKDVGYVSRKLMRTLENCVVAYDGTVRYGRNIIQFRYGGTGYAPERLFRVRDELLPFLPLDAERVARETSHAPARDEWTSVPYRWSGSASADASASAGSDADAQDETGVDVVARAPSSVRAAYESFFARASVSRRGWSQDQLSRAEAHVRRRMARAVVEPGDPVGCRAAHGIGQPCTQMTLNTFHHNGLSFAAVSGQSRIQEILHATRNDKTPILTLHVTSASLADAVVRRLRRLDVREFVVDSRVVPFTSAYEAPTWERVWFACFGRAAAAPTEKQKQKRKRKRGEAAATAAVAAATHVLELRLREDFLRKTQTTLASVRAVLLALPHVVDVTHTHESRGRRIMALGAHESVVHVFVRTPNPYGAMRRVLAQPMQGHACFGAWSNVSGTKVEIACAAKTEAQRCIWLSQTLSDDAVAHARTECNSLFATFRACGIEAARQCVVRELQKTFEADGASTISQTHLALLADTMCFSGFPMGIHSSGVARTMGSALMRACYERSLETMAAAAAAQRRDSTRDVSSRVAMGRAATVGASANVQLIMDVDALRLRVRDEEEDRAHALEEGRDAGGDADAGGDGFGFGFGFGFGLTATATRAPTTQTTQPHEDHWFEEQTWGEWRAPAPAPASAPAPAPVPAPVTRGWSWNGGW